MGILLSMFTLSVLRLSAALLVCGLVACAAPRIQNHPDTTQNPQLTPDAAIMADGYRLPLTVWSPPGTSGIVVLALHGFNDYRASFEEPAGFLARHGVITYAYDQRGFGETQQRGIWPGSIRMRDDAATVSRMLCERYPDLPLFILGESMGGAVAMDMMQAYEDSCISGVILVAPAVWGWQTMPALQRSALRLMAHSFPGYSPTGEGLGVVASDNREMLHEKWLDPLVIKATRIDAIYGLTNLMESALLASGDINRPAFILYGERDEIIPVGATCQMLHTLPTLPPPHWRMALYPEGYHMLTRDLQAEVVYTDMLAWLADQQAPLPSGQEVGLQAPRLQAFCGES
jgi:alpha-beta hydrolase superfamily lysophospholipase